MGRIAAPQALDHKCHSKSAFVGASLQQLFAAARLPDSGISEIAVNASLAFIEGAKPAAISSAP